MTTATPAAVQIECAEYVGQLEPGEPDWHAARRFRVGGSEIAPILGLSPWDSFFSLWHRKRGAIGDIDENEQMRWGKKLEALVCDELAACHPELRVMPGGSWVNRERPFQLASPDRLAVDVATGALVCVEAKTDRFDDGWGEPGTDQIPVHYRCQVQWYLDCLGLTRCVVPVLFAGSDYREYAVVYDPAEAQTLRAAAVEFVARLRAGTPPDVDKHTATYQALRELHPDIDDVTVEIPMDLADAYRQALDAADEAKQAKQYATNLIADAMGNARKCKDPMGGPVAIRMSKQGGTPYVSAARGSR